MMDKMLRLELFVDNKREALIQLPVAKGYIKIVKEYLDDALNNIDEKAQKIKEMKG